MFLSTNITSVYIPSIHSITIELKQNNNIFSDIAALDRLTRLLIELMESFPLCKVQVPYCRREAVKQALVNPASGI